MVVNVNKVLLGLKNVLSGYDVAQDLYTGKSEKFIVFTYADERADYYADNDEQAVTANMQISIYTPIGYNYMADKKIIKEYLKENGGTSITYKSWVDQDIKGTAIMRRQLFEADFTATE